MSDSAVADAVTGEAPPDRPHPSRRDRLGRVLRLLLAAGSGLLLTLAFPGVTHLPPGWWWAAPIAVAGLVLATRDRSKKFGALAGYLFGLGFFVPHLHWSGIYVGALPWFALAGAEAGFLAALGALLPRIWKVPFGAFGTAVAGGGLWVLQEALRDRLPFGGFPWGRLAFSQADAPTAGLAAVGGQPLVTFAVALTGTLLAMAVVRATGPSRLPRPGLSSAVALVGAVAVTLVGLAVPLPTNGEAKAGGEVRVAAVQGNVPEAGLEFNAERRAVLDNHAKTTLALADRIRSGQAKQPDIVIWPENSSDIDPYQNADAAEVITDAVDAIKAPTLVGAVVDGPDPYLSNTSILWTPADGPTATYVKRHPAPFGEYIPYRSFFRHFSDKVDLVRKDFVSGDRLRKDPVGVFDMGRARVGDVICFEVAYDGLVRDNVKHGADLLAVQTNNATFGFTAESVQQLAMSRLRAIESGRAVVHVSTVGVSAVILPNGTVLQRSSLFTRDVLEADVPLRTSLTLATRVGEGPEWVLAALAAGLLLAGALRRRRTA